MITSLMNLCVHFRLLLDSVDSFIEGNVYNFDDAKFPYALHMAGCKTEGEHNYSALKSVFSVDSFITSCIARQKIGIVMKFIDTYCMYLAQTDGIITCRYNSV